MNLYEEIMAHRYGQRYIDYRESYVSCNSKNYLDFPLEIDLDLIDACNLKCPTCHSNGRVRSNNSMQKGLITQILDECNEYNMPAINIGGCGEPLVNMELVNYSLAKLKKTSVMDIFLHTNGVLLNEKNAHALIDGGVTYLCISIDAISQDVYQKMRGSELSIILSNIEKFLLIRKDRLPILRVSFLATTINNHEKNSFIDFWKDKADIVDVQNYIKLYDTQPNVALTEKITERTPLAYQRKKRIAIVAPDFLCTSCGGLEVEDAISQCNTLSKHKSIKNYWDNYILTI